MSHVDSQAATVALSAIEEAFPKRPFPPAAAVVCAGQWFDEAGQPHEYDDPEANMVARFFAGAPWMEISGDDLLGRWPPANVSLRFLTPKALAYYIPAYMKAFLTKPLDPVGFAVLESAISVLTAPAAAGDEHSPRGLPPDTRSYAQKRAMDKEDVEFFQDFVRELDDAQKVAIATFLEAVEPLLEEEFLENTVRTALDRYWRRYRKGS